MKRLEHLRCRYLSKGSATNALDAIHLNTTESSLFADTRSQASMTPTPYNIKGILHSSGRGMSGNKNSDIPQLVKALHASFPSETPDLVCRNISLADGLTSQRIWAWACLP
jgi:hypothetical protein